MTPSGTRRPTPTTTRVGSPRNAILGGFTTSYTSDAVGRVKTIKDPKNAVVTLGYDLAGQQTSITDPRSKVWQTTYDALGGVKTTTDPLGRATTSNYNDAGQLVQQTDARGIAVGYAYDDAGNLTHVTAAPIYSITFTYDALGRRKTTGDGSGATTWSYDGASRVTSVAAPAGTVGYSYDDAGRRSTMTLPSGTVTYGYTDDDRLASLTGPTGAFSFSYFADGRPQTVARPNGVSTTDGYDAAGRLTSITHKKGAATLAAFTYTLDASWEPDVPHDGAGHRGLHDQRAQPADQGDPAGRGRDRLHVRPSRQSRDQGGRRHDHDLHLRQRFAADLGRGHALHL